MREFWPEKDELIDAAINRPVAAGIVALVKNTAVRPDHLTLLGMVLGVAAGLCFAYGFLPAGALLIFAITVLDCADGQLARAQGGGSAIGVLLDGLTDYVGAISIHLGILVHLLAHPPAFFGWEPTRTALVLLVVLSGACMALKALIFDHHKKNYTRFVPPSEGGLVGSYLRFQEWLSGDARNTTPGTLRALGIIGPTMHMYVILVTALIPGAVGWYLFFALIPSNLYLAVVLVAQRSGNGRRAQVSLAQRNPR